MKLLNAVFSYNRYYLLKNTVDSLLEFGPEGDVLVVDDGSDDPRVVEYLRSLEGRAAVVRRDRQERDFHGGLYENMNLAVDRALAGGHSHVFFIQDDVQFMWKDAGFAARVEKIFAARPDAAMVFPIFQKGILAAALGARMEPHPEAEAWHLTPYGIADMGVMPLSLLREKAWRFLPSEGENARVWRSWGYKLYIPSAPSVAWVPWPTALAFGRRASSERRPVERYFLRPLTGSQTAVLKNRSLKDLVYHEDFCLPWGWRCLSPYWFTRSRREYLKTLWSARVMPRLAGAR